MMWIPVKCPIFGIYFTISQCVFTCVCFSIFDLVNFFKRIEICFDIFQPCFKLWLGINNGFLWNTPFLKFSSEWCFQKRHVLVTCKVNIPRFGFISENSLKPMFGTRIGNIWFSWRGFHLLWCFAVKWNLSPPWTTYENFVRFRNNHYEYKKTVFWVDFRSFKLPVT